MGRFSIFMYLTVLTGLHANVQLCAFNKDIMIFSKAYQFHRRY